MRYGLHKFFGLPAKRHNVATSCFQLFWKTTTASHFSNCRSWGNSTETTSRTFSWRHSRIEPLLLLKRICSAPQIAADKKVWSHNHCSPYMLETFKTSTTSPVYAWLPEILRSKCRKPQFAKSAFLQWFQKMPTWNRRELAWIMEIPSWGPTWSDLRLHRIRGEVPGTRKNEAHLERPSIGQFVSLSHLKPSSRTHGQSRLDLYPLLWSQPQNARQDCLAEKRRPQNHRQRQTFEEAQGWPRLLLRALYSLQWQ